MNGALRMRSTAALASAALVAWLGCAASQPLHVAQDQREDRLLPGQPMTALGETGSPWAEPAENRLLANYAQHTFATIGRDFDPDISRDGARLAFASTAHAERPDVYLKSVDGYAVTQLTSDPADDLQPRFSPDGQSLLFCSNRTGNWDVWLVRLDGTGLTQLTHDHADEIGACWSPDGSQIAFSVLGKASRQWEIWTLSVASPGVRRFLAYGLLPDWSPDGKRIAFQRARQRGTKWYGVWVVDLVNGEARNPTEIAYSDSGACITPRWALDGRSIVCTVVSRPGVDGGTPASDLWVVDAQSGVRRKLTDGAAPVFNPTFSVAGRVYFVGARQGVENIWSLADASGTTETSSHGDLGKNSSGARHTTMARSAAGESDPHGEPDAPHVETPRTALNQPTRAGSSGEGP